MTQRRYSAYVNATREPNFADLLRACDALSTDPDHVLGVTQPKPGDGAERRVSMAFRSMTFEAKQLAVDAVEGMASARTRRSARKRTLSIETT